VRNLIFPVLLGVVGCAILLWLGFWQLQRLEWKEGILADIDARIAADPVPLSLNVSRALDNYRGNCMFWPQAPQPALVFV